MVRVSVYVTNLSGERLWDVDHELPVQLQIAVNLNLLGFEEVDGGSSLQTPFVFTVNFTPAIAQISIRGRAKIEGGKDELAKILQEGKEQKPPPQQVVQSIVNVTMAEVIILSRSIGIPPPLPPIPPPPSSLQPSKLPKQNSRYTT